MCGIFGYIGDRDAAPLLLDGLRRLEYRGYDSTGIAVITPDGRLTVRKREGKLARLVEDLDGNLPPGGLGVGHTRWATHGPPTTVNAHPHADSAGRIVLVHNGIVENYAALKAELVAAGHDLKSATDTEIVAHLVGAAYDRAGGNGAGGGSSGARLSAAVAEALGRIDGSYALAVMATDAPGAIVAARRFSPLVVGLAAGETLLASDIPALLPHTRTVLPLHDGEIAELSRDGARITDLDGRPVDRAPLEVTWDAEAAERGGYPHFVRKEIDEQPVALADTLRGRLVGDRIELGELEDLPLDAVRRVCVVAAGTSLFAGLVGRLLLERWARLPVEVSVASELRYGDPVLGPDTLTVVVTQSGETADTLAGLRLAREMGSPTLALTNVVGSSVTREADSTLYLQVGPEIGVVATKTFTGQLALLVLLAAELGRRRGHMDDTAVAGLVRDMRAVPEHIAVALQGEAGIAEVARELADRRSMFYIGRGLNYPIALEGALKLKEISYIHAEGYPAGELKHGPIAMLEPGIPVFVIGTRGPTYPKIVSNVQEVRARGSEVVAIVTEGDTELAELADHVFSVPDVREALAPFVTVVPTQLFAYHVAVTLGRDVDQPRNLAKSVTVE